MRSWAVFIFFVIIQSSLGLGSYCTDDGDAYQNNAQGNGVYIRRTSPEDEEVQSRLIPGNKNSNINVNSGSLYQQPIGVPSGQSNSDSLNAIAGGGFTEWWEIVTSRPARRSEIKAESTLHTNTYDTAKSRIGNNQNYGQSRKSSLETHGQSQLQETPKRSKLLTSPQRSLSKSRKNENPENQNEIHRKSNNENVNTNVNQFSRRNLNTQEASIHSETRKSSNKNKNVNVNDYSSNGLEDVNEIYGKLTRGGSPEDGSAAPQELAYRTRPYGARSHSNVNHNVNANVHGDMSHGVGVSRPDDNRRNLFNKNNLFPRPHHPNDNHNVNININGEESNMDDQPNEQGEYSEGEPNNVPGKGGE